MRIASFNVQNLRLRRLDGDARLDGARDGDVSEDAGEEARALDEADRRLTAAVIADTRADLVCMQEVFDRATLDHFHDEFLLPTGTPPWPYRVCLPGNDGRGRDLAVLSRRPLAAVESHAALMPGDLGLDLPEGVNPDVPVFRRDCLVFRVGPISFFLCHFKAPYPEPDVAWKVRRLEAQAVRTLIEARFGAACGEALWLVLGDLNEPAREPRGERAIAPLIGEFSVDLLERLPRAERWSYHLAEERIYSRPDAMLASPALARRWPGAVPAILREGMGAEAERARDARLPGVGVHRPHASDHAALVVEFDGI